MRQPTTPRAVGTSYRYDTLQYTLRYLSTVATVQYRYVFSRDTRKTRNTRKKFEGNDGSVRRSSISRSPSREMAPVTRRRLSTLRSAIVLDEDLLALVMELCALRDVARTAAVCKFWRDCAVREACKRRNSPSLYLVGGCSGGAHPASAQAQQSVLRYDPIGDEWLAVASMHKPRDHLALVACGGHLYALGGWSGSHNRTRRLWLERPH